MISARWNIAATVLCGAFACSSIALAQGVPLSSGSSGKLDDGIAVTATGVATGAPDSARLTLNLYSRGRTLTTQALQPLSDALVHAGAESGSVRIGQIFHSGENSSASISATIANPTAQTLMHGLPVVEAADHLSAEHNGQQR